jgi:hypothetical protein
VKSGDTLLNSLVREQISMVSPELTWDSVVSPIIDAGTFCEQDCTAFIAFSSQVCLEVPLDLGALLAQLRLEDQRGQEVPACLEVPVIRF